MFPCFRVSAQKHRGRIFFRKKMNSFTNFFLYTYHIFFCNNGNNGNNPVNMRLSRLEKAETYRKQAETFSKKECL